MAISLLELPNGNLSLEFDETDHPRVFAAIPAQFGDTAQKHYVMASEVSFGGARFIY